jgi:protein-S-isoprenylcysteine O-methyltransferase Ste14
VIYFRPSFQNLFLKLLPFGASIGFVLLMLLGWGSLGFFLKVPHLIITITVLTSPFFLPNAKEGLAAKRKELGESKMEFFAISIISLIGTAYFLPFFYSRGIGAFLFPESIPYLGALILLSGYFVRILASRTLRRQFSHYVTVHEYHQLITNGIYSLIRHPIYLGKLLALLGMFLVFPSWYGLFFFVLYSSILVRRISREERLLLKHFGSVYEEYTLKSFRLIPHLY